MLANGSACSIGGWQPDQYSSLFYSPSSDQSGIFDTVSQKQQQQQQQQLQMVQHAKNEHNMAVGDSLSPSFIGNNGIGPCPSNQIQSLPAHLPTTAFHPSTAPPSACSSSSTCYPAIAAAYQTQCHNQLANFVQSALGIPAGAAAMTMAAAQQSAGERPRMSSKKKPRPVPEERKDQAYRERRKKNNDSARRSRDQRRRKEEETAQRNAALEKENAQLQNKLQLVMMELFSLRQQAATIMCTDRC